MHTCIHAWMRRAVGWVSLTLAASRARCPGDSTRMRVCVCVSHTSYGCHALSTAWSDHVQLEMVQHVH